MREISVQTITDVVERLCIEANTHLPGDVKCAIEHCRGCEDGTIAQVLATKGSNVDTGAALVVLG